MSGAHSVPKDFTLRFLQIVDDSNVVRIPGFEDLGVGIADTTLFVGYPKHLDKLGTMEHAFDLTDDYYTNILCILKSRSEKKLNMMRSSRHINEDNWPILPVDVSSCAPLNFEFYTRKYSRESELDYWVS